METKYRYNGYGGFTNDLIDAFSDLLQQLSSEEEKEIIDLKFEEILDDGK